MGSGEGIIVAIANQKGGVGKTTTAINLGASIAVGGKKVLIIDIDPQANATSGLGFEQIPISYKLLLGELPVDEAIKKTEVDNLFLIPSGIDLVGFEVEFASSDERHYLLSKRLEGIKGFDFIFIDCPPSLGLLTVNALVAAQKVLIPLQCEYYALEGLSKLINTIEIVREGMNVHLKILGIVLTMFDGRTNLSRQVENEVRKFFPKEVFNTVIPRTVRLSEAPSFGKPIFLYDASSSGTVAYTKLAEEFIRRIENERKGTR
jgi:chromosome partitioning protein